MFRRKTRLPFAHIFVLGAVLLLFPLSGFAQRHGSGGTVGGGGMMGGGRATGVDQKDDLKGFHQAMAVQASSDQVQQYNAMVKMTAAAADELHRLEEQVTKENEASGLSGRIGTVAQALETARNENKKFIDGFSGPQKSGLKEITKRLAKADSELAQRASEIQRADEAKLGGVAIAGAAQNLERALTIFQNQQLSLGRDMSIVDSGEAAQNSVFSIAPVKNSIDFKSEHIATVSSGVITKSSGTTDQNKFTFQLTADLSELQQDFTGVLRAQLDRNNRCGERIAIQNATLAPAAPTSVVRAQLHYERWACLGKDTMNEMVEGDGTIDMKVTPAVGDDGTLRLTPEMVRVDAQGLVGDLLRSGSLSDLLRDKISDALLSTMKRSNDFALMLPPSAQGNATLRHAQFGSTGTGGLTAVLEGEIHVSNDKVSSLTNELKERSSSQVAATQ